MGLNFIERTKQKAATKLLQPVITAVILLAYEELSEELAKHDLQIPFDENEFANALLAKLQRRMAEV